MALSRRRFFRLGIGGSVGGAFGLMHAGLVLPSNATAASHISYGINLSGGEFGPQDGSGALNTHFTYDQKAHVIRTWARLLAPIAPVFRIPLRVERVQQWQYQNPLNSQAIAGITTILDRINAVGGAAILEWHQAGDWWRTAVVQNNDNARNDFLDSLKRLMLATKDHPVMARTASGYELWNEPHAFPGGAAQWKDWARRGVLILRDFGWTGRIYVDGYGYASANRWVAEGNADLHVGMDFSRGPNVMAAHQYGDSDESGTYANNALPQNPDIFVQRLSHAGAFVSYLNANNLQGAITEIGAPEHDQWVEAERRAYSYLNTQSRIVAVTRWGGGPWWDKNYILRAEPPAACDLLATAQVG